MMDLVAEGRSSTCPRSPGSNNEDRALIEYSSRRRASWREWPSPRARRTAGYARNIGLAFQIADDLIDHSGDEAAAGKRTGKDAPAGKATFVSLLGEERARQQAQLLVERRSSTLMTTGERRFAARHRPLRNRTEH